MSQALSHKETYSEITFMCFLKKARNQKNFNRSVSGQNIQVTIIAGVIWYCLKVHKAAFGIFSIQITL